MRATTDSAVRQWGRWSVPLAEGCVFFLFTMEIYKAVTSEEAGYQNESILFFYV